MDAYIEKLRTYLAEQELNYGIGNAESILEMVFYHYNECNGFDNQPIRAGFTELYAQLNERSLRDVDKVIDIVCALCRDHEKVGFVEGVKLGICLDQELE